MKNEALRTAMYLLCIYHEFPSTWFLCVQLLARARYMTTARRALTRTTWLVQPRTAGASHHSHVLIDSTTHFRCDFPRACRMTSAIQPVRKHDCIAEEQPKGGGCCARGSATGAEQHEVLGSCGRGWRAVECTLAPGSHENEPHIRDGRDVTLASSDGRHSAFASRPLLTIAQCSGTGWG